MSLTSAESTTDRALREIEERVLWLATAIVDHANRGRPNPSGLKVGGHQASSASMVTLMTSLWLGQLRADHRVSVKPHASPVLHALEYLLGTLDRKYLTTLREFGGLQSYPSRLKDPVPADYSTGSVGIGATAPIWGAIARRYVNTQLAAGGRTRPRSAPDRKSTRLKSSYPSISYAVFCLKKKKKKREKRNIKKNIQIKHHAHPGSTRPEKRAQQKTN